MHLGPIAGTWSCSPDGDELPFDIVHYVTTKKAGGTASEGTEIYSTLGLSNYPLGRERLRIEMLMIVPAHHRRGDPRCCCTPGALPIEASSSRFGDVFADARRESAEDMLYVGRPYQRPEFERLTRRRIIRG